MTKKDRLIFYFNKQLDWVRLHIVLTFHNLLKFTNKPSMVLGLSYFPASPFRKSKKNVLSDQLKAILKWGDINHYYYLYGLDVKMPQECKAYVHYNEFSLKRDEFNSALTFDTRCILRNKLLFGLMAERIGIGTPTNVAHIINKDNVEILSSNSNCSLQEFVATHNGTFFCKIIDGECGKGVFKLEIKEGDIMINEGKSSFEELLKDIEGGEFLVQTCLQQHSEMNRLYPKAINSIRLITIKNPETGEIDYFPSILRVGAHGSLVDNTSQGGFAVAFNPENGQLIPPGFHKPEFGLTVTKHPDTGVELKDFKIPFIQEAISQAKRFHRLIGLHSIGWDVAIGPEGPIFIEGNDNWEINGPQSVNGGLRDKFEFYFKGKAR
ncbi:MAG: hypothetical protein LIP15_23535 [Clostridium sp.]|nr:hypothetical protein [Clostridium sp.]